MKNIPAVPRKTPRPAEPESEAVRLIRAERQRQIEVEGWTHAHDDAHDNGELADAASCYFRHGTSALLPLRPDGVPHEWPGAAEWWKPKDRIANLIRAGALLTAEIERLNRASKNPEFVVTERQFDHAFTAPIRSATRRRAIVIRELELALEGKALNEITEPGR
ncbi:MAG: hypothetical protein ABGX47_23885 [Martelella sp.]|uniref:hypothetical protein n=1 Tax=Martelella sp. TaxID=1969699 RepID=UPI0032429CDF